LGSLSHFYLIADKLVGLTDERLGQLETQHRGIEPVKIGPAVFGLFDEDVKKLVLAAAVVAEYELLFALFKNQLFFLLCSRQPCLFVSTNTKSGTTPSLLFIGLSSAY